MKWKKWIEALSKLKQGEPHAKCPHCGKETLDYGFIASSENNKIGFGAIWCDSCHYGSRVCRASLKNENKIIEDFPKEITFVS